MIEGSKRDLLMMVAVGIIVIASSLIIATIIALAKAPHAILMAEAEREGGEVVRILLIHRGGATLSGNELEVLAEDSRGYLRSVAMRWDGPFSPGDECWGSYEYGGNPSGRTMRVR
ncbi:MAG: hypothetical protein QMC89_06030 [Candidatus Hodarchaeaceae archaeon]|nr:hypothetical protein [Candidatus Hodarchaeaceae archaeon]